MPESPPKRRGRSSRTTQSPIDPAARSIGTSAAAASAIQRAAGAENRLFVLHAASVASTAPFSTAGNWSGSPSRITRVCGFNARSNFASNGRSTIEHSSTTSTSRSSGRCASRAGNTACGRKPSRRCRVMASAGSAARSESDSGNAARPARTDSLSRCAALPVGAASAMRNGCPAKCCNSARTRSTVNVLPVPGPPQITVRRERSALTAAMRCQSVSAESPGGSRRSSAMRTEAASSGADGSAARERNAFSISRS